MEKVVALFKNKSGLIIGDHGFTAEKLTTVEELGR